jgi:hypothetical protein
MTHDKETKRVASTEVEKPQERAQHNAAKRFTERAEEAKPMPQVPLANVSQKAAGPDASPVADGNEDPGAVLTVPDHAPTDSERNEALAKTHR